MTSMEIRKPDPAELAIIMKLSPQSMFEGTQGRAELSEDKIKQLIEPILAKGGYYLIAAENNKLMGWILAGSNLDPFTDHSIGFIYELCVVKEFWGNGVAKFLLKDAIDRLKSEGYPEIRLNVFSDNPAVHLYKQMGFSERNMAMSLKDF